MGLTEYKLGQLIEQIDRRNTALRYGIEDVRGVSNTKEIRPTKANVDDRAFDKFYIVEPKEFIFNRRTTRNGERLGLGFNNTDRAYIFTEDYIAFTIKESAKQTLLPEYLYLFFLRDEFDRYVRYNSWGSATEFFNWEEMCGVPILLPDLSVQQKAVDAYNAINANLAAYADGLQDLKLTCNLYMDNIKKNYSRMQIGSLLSEIDIRNKDMKISNVLGINIEKTFMPSVANLNDTDITKYKVIEKGQFAYSPMQTGRDETVRVALFSKEEKAVISPAYSVLQLKTEDVLAEYLMIWFKREESDRYGWFLSDGSVRASLEVKRFFEIEIPIPPKPIQQSIVDIYHAQYERQEVAEFLNKTLREICPILIRQSLTDET